MSAPSIARDFFDRIVNATDPIATIRALVNTVAPVFETDWLEFKTEHQDPKQRDRKGGQTWSESLGAFANNQGGVLVWGIDARKTQVGGASIGAAIAHKPVENPLALKTPC
jgi:predicted HTH transcriptional regulator